MAQLDFTTQTNFFFLIWIKCWGNYTTKDNKTQIDCRMIVTYALRPALHPWPPWWDAWFADWCVPAPSHGAADSHERQGYPPGTRWTQAAAGPHPWCHGPRTLALTRSTNPTPPQTFTARPFQLPWSSTARPLCYTDGNDMFRR